MKNLPVSAGYDTPSLLDWEYKDVVGKEGGSSVEVMSWKELADLIKFFNQYDDHRTIRGCGWYGLTHAENAGRIVQDKDWGKEQQINPAKRRIPRQSHRLPHQQYRGTNIQLNLSIFRGKGWISGHARCDGIQNSSDVLSDGNMIYTGSNDCDWLKSYETGLYHRANGQTVGHLFFAFGEDKERGGFLLGDSNGPEFGPIFIKYEDWNSLYSKNAIFLKDNSDLINKYRKMSQFDKEFDTAIEYGITNGERPQEPGTRKENAVMSLRAVEKLIPVHLEHQKDAIMVEMKAYIDDKFEDILAVLGK